MTKKIIFLCFIFCYGFAFAQEKTLPIHLSLFNESTALPFTRFFTLPVHLGGQIGTDFTYSRTRKEHSRLFQTANVAYFYHKYLAQGIGINTELGYEYRLKSGVAFDALLGMGYMHTFRTAKEYVFENGQYTAKNDKGNARFYPSLSFDVAYYLKKEIANSPKIFLRYQSWVEYPYSPGFIPLMTHINLHLGATFYLHFNTSKND